MEIPIIASIILACFITITTWVVIALIMICHDLTFKDMFSIKAIKMFKYNFNDLFSLKFTLIVIGIVALLIMPITFEANDKSQAKKNNMCTCDCEICKKTTRKIEIIEKYLISNDKSIEDLLNEKKKED